MSDTSTEMIRRRFAELVVAGEQLLARLGFKGSSVVKDDDRPEVLSWLLSTINLLEVSIPADSRYRIEAVRLLPKSDHTISLTEVGNILGILKSAAAEYSLGLMNSVEFYFVGLAFEQFLEHASHYNDQGKKTEAAVLASAVLEDTVKRLSRKHGIATDDNKTLEQLINALKSNRVVSKVKAERLKSYAALRNQAFHAEWDAFDGRDLRQMIEGLEELLDTHFKSSNSEQ